LNNVIPVIDLFAGPGGLGEGFHSLQKRNCFPFHTKLSIEKDKNAHSTLRLRSFFRQFSPEEIPEEYYKLLRGEISENELYLKYSPEAEKAQRESWHAELGEVSGEELNARIKEALAGKKNWVLIGGPPCQAYSVVGRARLSKVWKNDPEVRDSDTRHYLYKEYLRILAVHKPPVFIMENVRGILTSKLSDGPIINKILKDLRNPTRVFRKIGAGSVRYRLYSLVKKSSGLDMEIGNVLSPADFVIKAEEYGIPQRRHRVIIMGIRQEIEKEPELLKRKKYEVTVGNVINDLPVIRSSFSRKKDSFKGWKKSIIQFVDYTIKTSNGISSELKEEFKKQKRKLNGYLDTGSLFIHKPNKSEVSCLNEWYVDSRLKGYCNHITKSHMISDIHRYFFVACFGRVYKFSPKLKDFPENLLPDHQNVGRGVRKGLFADRFRVQLADKSATTITSHIHKDGHYYIHPDPSQARSLTVREAARIQTFPDNYFFCGSKTQQFRQVGNAVPPLLANRIAEIVYRVIG